MTMKYPVFRVYNHRSTAFLYVTLAPQLMLPDRKEDKEEVLNQLRHLNTSDEEVNDVSYQGALEPPIGFLTPLLEPAFTAVAPTPGWEAFFHKTAPVSFRAEDWTPVFDEIALPEGISW